MSRVSESGEELFTQLVAWEMLGRADLDPQLLLRQVPLSDLCIVSASLQKSGDLVKDFVSTTMVDLEMQYRRGALEGDWGVKRDGQKVCLQYSPRGRSSISSSMNLVGTGAEV